MSGFDTEYRRGGFALISIAEYARILLIRIEFSLIFLGGDLISPFYNVKLVIVDFAFVWVRRFRYDKPIYLA